MRCPGRVHRPSLDSQWSLLLPALRPVFKPENSKSSQIAISLIHKSCFCLSSESCLLFMLPRSPALILGLACKGWLEPPIRKWISLDPPVVLVQAQGHVKWKTEEEHVSLGV